MSDKILQQIKYVLVISILNALLWKYWITPIVDLENDFNGPLRKFYMSPEEWIKYTLNAILVVFVMYYPFIADKKFKPHLPYWFGMPILTMVFVAAAWYLDPNVKGTYLVEVHGDDFGFTWPIIRCFFYFPFILFFFSYVLITKIKLRYLLGIFPIGLFIVIMLLIEVGGNHGVEWINFRRTVASGRWLFFVTLMLGITFIMIKESHESDDETSKSIYDDELLDRPI